MGKKIKIKSETPEGFTFINKVYNDLPDLIRSKMDEGTDHAIAKNFYAFKTDDSFLGIYDSKYICYFPKNIFDIKIEDRYYLNHDKKETGIKITGRFMIGNKTISVTYSFMQGVLPSNIEFI